MKYKIKFTEFERLLIKATKYHFGKSPNPVWCLHSIHYGYEFNEKSSNDLRIILENFNKIVIKLGQPINIISLVCNESVYERVFKVKTKSEVLFWELYAVIQNSTVQNNFSLRTPIAVQKRIKSLLKEQNV